ncbi:MAG TPA: DUF58 domain-containing protein [Gaiellales bacterium]|nr:DUF58 domain-containing protein [Gaiellales bacterium]
MTSRGTGTLLLAFALYIASWGFGTSAMYPVAVGLFAAPLIAWLWVRLTAKPTNLRRRTGHRELVEGGRVGVEVEVRGDGGLLPARATMLEKIGDLGTQEVPLRHVGHALRGRYVIDPAPRGRYTLAAAELRVDDPLGLAESLTALERSDTLLVYPRVYALDGLFTDAGTAGGDEGRALLHRTAGYDLHSIRDFQQGESLRRVHWRSTAKRRKLMVKELTELPRDESAVLLDCDRTAEVGPPGSSSFDAQVRVAASLMNRMVETGQRCSLVIHGPTRRRIRVQAGGGDWGAALAALAAVRADAHRPLAAMLSEALGATGAAEAIDAARLYIVTGALSPQVASRVLALRSARRDVAVVAVDAASFAGVEHVPGSADSAALQLAASGVAVARVRAGDDIGDVLSSAMARKAALRG